jgi:hypothetical protein
LREDNNIVLAAGFKLPVMSSLFSLTSQIQDSRRPSNGHQTHPTETKNYLRGFRENNGEKHHLEDLANGKYRLATKIID